MNRVRIVIVEDEFVIAEDIKLLLVENGYEVMASFDTAEEAITFVIHEQPDLLLVDIRLSGKMTGIDLAKKVKQSFNIPIIYLTANSDKETYENARATNPNAFLVKPFTPFNLLASIDLAIFNYSNGKTPESIGKPMLVEEDYSAIIHKYLFIKSNGKHKKISSDDILFVEAAGSYVHIQTLNERFTLTHNLSNFLKKTPMEDVIRIHRSYLVNINRVDSFEDSSVYLMNHKLPLSEGYKEEFMKRIHCL